MVGSQIFAPQGEMNLINNVSVEEKTLCRFAAIPGTIGVDSSFYRFFDFFGSI